MQSSLLVRLILVSGTIFLAGCSSGPPLNPPTGTIGGIPAMKSKVVVRQQQDVKTYANMYWVLPVGEYRPAFEDATGVYYEAPSEMKANEVVFGVRLASNPMTGGIFLERANPTVAKIYEIGSTTKGGEIQRALHGGRPSVPKLPRGGPPIQFQLTKS